MSDDTNNSTDYSPIQCQLYDYIEIACMRHYKLDIELLTGNIITGKALTTNINNKQEFIVAEFTTKHSNKALAEISTLAIETDGIEIDKASQPIEIKIRLDLIKSITALDKNAEFGTVAIN